MDPYKGNLTSICQGAEARIYDTIYLGRPTIIKERFSKKYRIKEIDEKLTKKRLTQEVRALQRCRKLGIPSPLIYLIDSLRSTIFLEKIEGSTVRDLVSTDIKENPAGNYEALYPLAKLIGKTLADMHLANIIHGDLTTSNMIVKEVKNNSVAGYQQIYLIDFGLSSSSSLPEDKGVDLYVLERAFLSTHPGSEELFVVLMQSYQENLKNPTPIINKLDEVRMRGRKRTMVG